MSLNWNVEKIEHYEQVCFITATQDVPDRDVKVGDRLLNPVTNCLIWQSMATGLGKSWTLDADFAPEFYARIKLLEKLDGPFLVNADGSSRGITWQDVQAHVGLHCNVSPVSRTAFLKNAVAVDLDRDARRYKQLVEASPLPV